MSDNDSDFGNFLAGFVIGGLVGAATALLLAPQSGEETRAVIREKSIELKDRAVESAEDARERAEVALEDARLRAERAYEDVRMRAEELAEISKERATGLQERGRQVVEEQRSRINQAIDAGKKAAGAAKEAAIEEMEKEPDTRPPDLTFDNPPVSEDQSPPVI